MAQFTVIHRKAVVQKRHPGTILQLHIIRVGGQPTQIEGCPQFSVILPVDLAGCMFDAIRANQHGCCVGSQFRTINTNRDLAFVAARRSSKFRDRKVQGIGSYSISIGCTRCIVSHDIIRPTLGVGNHKALIGRIGLIEPIIGVRPARHCVITDKKFSTPVSGSTVKIDS